MESATSLPPQRISQIHLGVEDVERATTFYRDVLGLEHLFSAPPGLSFFQCGDVRLMLSAPEGSDDSSPSSILYYGVEDVMAAHTALVERGAEPRGEPHVVHRTESTELWMAFFRDVEGNTFALMHEASLRP